MLPHDSRDDVSTPPMLVNAALGRLHLPIPNNYFLVSRAAQAVQYT
jgi:hypothetical protein